MSGAAPRPDALRVAAAQEQYNRGVNSSALRSWLRVFPRFAAVLLASAVTILAAAAVPLDDAAIGRQMVADVYARLSLQSVKAAEARPDLLQTAALLALEAAALTPDDAEVWRLVLRIADLQDRTATEPNPIALQALSNIARLDPADDTVTLRRLRLSVDRRGTAEEKLAAYELLLSDKNLASLPASVASHLALDAARLLLEREGATPAYAAKLASAASLDPSNHAAAEEAALFYLDRVNDDPAGAAETMIAVVLSDPGDLEWQTALAHHLLNNGAYRGAARLYQSARRIALAASDDIGDVAVDLAIAQWASGDSVGALRTLDERQRQLNMIEAQRRLLEDSTLTPLDVDDVVAPTPRLVAATRAIIVATGGNAEATALVVEAASAAFDAEIALATEKSQADPIRLEQLWFKMALAPVERAEAMMADPALSEQLSPTAADRVRGWLHWRHGRHAEAIALLEPLRSDDPVAQLGLGLAYVSAGSTKEGARELLAVVRRMPGTLIGAWAGTELSRLLGQRVTISPIATELERLIDTVPAEFDRMVSEPGRLLAVQIQLAKQRFAVFEPATATISLINRSPLPLAIHPSGPILPQAAILSSVLIPTMPQVAHFPALVVDIDRRISLKPGERLEIPVRLTGSSFGDSMLVSPLMGASIRLSIMTNFVVTPTAITPGLLGTRNEAPTFRVEGIRITPEWVSETALSVENPDSLEDILALAALCTLSGAPQEEQGPNQSDEAKALISSAVSAVRLAYPKLDDFWAAWMLSMLPKTSPARDVVLENARSRDSRAVRIMYLVHQVDSIDDPMLKSAKAGDDPLLKGLAELVESLLVMAATPPEP